MISGLFINSRLVAERLVLYKERPLAKTSVCTPDRCDNKKEVAN